MAGEANRYAMVSTFIPATEEQLDHWLKLARDAEGTPPDRDAKMVTVRRLSQLVDAAQRLVQEVVLGRSMLRLKQEELEEAQRRERANAVLLQRAEEALRVAEQRRVAAEDAAREARKLVGKALS